MEKKPSRHPSLTVITVTVLKKQRDQWKKLAISKGQSLSTWCRMKLEEALREEEK